MNVALSIGLLEQFDPYGGGAGVESRYCCPLCGGDKPKDAHHRSLALNRLSGKWNCHRCHNGGVAQEFWAERPRPMNRRDRGRAQLRQAFRSPENGNIIPISPPADPQFREQLRDLVKLAGTPGAEYLAGRGIPLLIAQEARVRYSPTWFGRAAVVFPLYDADPAGNLVAAQGRYCDDRAPKVRSSGDVKFGVFATAGAWEQAALILVEAPIDALTLAAAGYPAIALCGASNCPAWLPQACALRRVLLALDGDAAGDAAAQRLAARLRPLGARVERLRPGWFKDWNSLEPRLLEGLEAALAAVLGSA